MDILKRLFDFYLRSSIHVAVAVYALVRLTQHMFSIPGDHDVALFAFFGTVTGYNFVKFDALARVRKGIIKSDIKAIAVLSFLSFIGAAWCFFRFSFTTQLISVSVVVLTALYTLPFFPNTKNARNWAGVKIYIVSLCWVGVTVALPILEAGTGFSWDFWLKSIQRFILVFVLILIFEIVDLAKDDPHLRTVPQQIGVGKTKNVGLLLLVAFYLLEFLRTVVDPLQLTANLALLLMVSLFLVFATPQRSRYYSAFWVESIPVVWWLLIVAAMSF